MLSPAPELAVQSLPEEEDLFYVSAEDILRDDFDGKRVTLELPGWSAS